MKTALVAERTQALQESQALYRLLIEDAQDVLWRTDSRLIVTYISPADERLRGFRADEVLGHSVFEMFTDEGVELVKGMLRRRAIEDTAGSSGGFLRFQVEHRCKDGRLIWGEIMSKPDRNAQGEIIGTLLVAPTQKSQARKRWMSDQLQLRGSVTVDEGAAVKLRAEGNAVCGQCHMPSAFDTPADRKSVV